MTARARSMISGCRAPPWRSISGRDGGSCPRFPTRPPHRVHTPLCNTCRCLEWWYKRSAVRQHSRIRRSAPPAVPSGNKGPRSTCRRNCNSRLCSRTPVSPRRDQQDTWRDRTIHRPDGPGRCPGRDPCLALCCGLSRRRSCCRRGRPDVGREACPGGRGSCLASFPWIRTRGSVHRIAHDPPWVLLRGAAKWKCRL